MKESNSRLIGSIRKPSAQVATSMCFMTSLMQSCITSVMLLVVVGMRCVSLPLLLLHIQNGALG